jgi:hypothetical protein
LVLEFENALLFLPLPILALEFIQIAILDALARLKVVLEVAMVRFVILYVCPLAVCLAITHLTLIIIAVCVDYSAVAFN